MLYWLAQYLQNNHHLFRVFQYLTFRSILAAMTALLVGLILGPYTIRWLRKMQIGQMVRDDGPQSHLTKVGTPTMGGVLVLLGISISTLLWADLRQVSVWIVLFVMLGFGLIGWVDDYKKLVLKNSKGLAGRWKYFWQSVVALLALYFLYAFAPSVWQTELTIPFLKHTVIALGGLSFLFGYFVIVGSSNAVNLTDGLDGLAIVPIVLVASALGIFVYASSNTLYAHYLAVKPLLEVLNFQAIGNPVQPIKQDNSQATYAPKILKQDGKINWSKSAISIECMIRAYKPWPIAYTLLNGHTIRIYKAVIETTMTEHAPGTIIDINASGIFVATNDGVLVIQALQFPSKNIVLVKDWFNAHQNQIKIGDIFS